MLISILAIGFDFHWQYEHQSVDFYLIMYFILQELGKTWSYVPHVPDNPVMSSQCNVSSNLDPTLKPWTSPFASSSNSLVFKNIGSNFRNLSSW